MHIIINETYVRKWKIKRNSFNDLLAKNVKINENIKLKQLQHTLISCVHAKTMLVKHFFQILTIAFEMVFN